MEDATSRSEPLRPVVQRVTPDDSVRSVVESAAREAGCTDPEALEDLFEHVDPDALDDLFPQSNGLDQASCKLLLDVDACRIIVYGDGRVVVAPSIDYDVHG